MSEQAAKKWLVISALSVFGIWWYRRWREGPQVVLDAPKFVAAWGTVYFVLSLVTEANPALGGSFSVLVMVSDVLGNALPAAKSPKGGLLADLTAQQKGAAPAGSAVGGWDTGQPAAAAQAAGQAPTVAITPLPPAVAITPLPPATSRLTATPPPGVTLLP